MPLATPIAAISIDETWYEKLGRWEDALDAYEHKQAANPFDVTLMLGRMRYGLFSGVRYGAVQRGVCALQMIAVVVCDKSTPRWQFLHTTTPCRRRSW